MEICKTDTVRLLRLLKEAALIIEDNCRGIRSLDKARQLRQTEDLNLRIGTTTSVTCGCPFRLSMRYSKPTEMYLNELKKKEIE